MVLPCFRGFSKQLKRVFLSYDIPAFFKSSNTLRQRLVRLRYTRDKEKVVGPVYHIQCEDCVALYVGETMGETEQSLRARFLEHHWPSTMTSAVSRHMHVDQPDHSVSLESAKILETFRPCGKTYSGDESADSGPRTISDCIVLHHLPNAI